jgi:hypothetical protein
MNNYVKIIDIAKPDNSVRSFDTYFKGNVTAVGCFSKGDNAIFTACDDGGLRIFYLRAKNIVK